MACNAAQPAVRASHPAHPDLRCTRTVRVFIWGVCHQPSAAVLKRRPSTRLRCRAFDGARAAGSVKSRCVWPSTWLPSARAPTQLTPSRACGQGPHTKDHVGAMHQYKGDPVRRRVSHQQQRRACELSSHGTLLTAAVRLSLRAWCAVESGGHLHVVDRCRIQVHGRHAQCT